MAHQSGLTINERRRLFRELTAVATWTDNTPRTIKFERDQSSFGHKEVITYTVTPIQALKLRPHLCGSPRTMATK